MTPNPVVIDGGLTITDALTRMFQIHARHLPVMVGGHLVGVLSDRDIGHLSAVQGLDPARVTAEQACTPNPYVCGPDTPIVEVAQTLIQHKFGAALVMEDRTLVGMFTVIDALGALVAVLQRDAAAAADPTHAWSVTAPDDVHLPTPKEPAMPRNDSRTPGTDLDPTRTDERTDLDADADRSDAPDLAGDPAGRDLIHAPDPRRDGLQTLEARKAELQTNHQTVYGPNPMSGVSTDVRSDAGRRADLRRAAATVRGRSESSS